MSIVKSFAVGNGDMFYIKHNSDNFTVIDCCMSDEDKYRIVNELGRGSVGKNIIRFISTHPDKDHILGLTYLHQKMSLRNFYCVNNGATKPDETDDFDQYCRLRDDPKIAFYISKGCSRRWMNLSGDGRDSSGISIPWPDLSNEQYKDALVQANNGECWNNISPIIRYELEGGPSVLWMGDLDTDFMDSLEVIPVGAADIVFAPHHGRDSGKIPCDWLERINPKLIIIGEAPAEHLNYYAGYNTITQNSAGDITFDCDSGKVHIYVSSPDYFVGFLDDEEMPASQGSYLGTLNLIRSESRYAA